MHSRNYFKLELLPFLGAVKRDFGIVNKNYRSCHFNGWFQFAPFFDTILLQTIQNGMIKLN